MNVLLIIVSHRVIAIVYVGILAIDITLLFVLAHALARKWPHPFFCTFDRIGTPIITSMMSAIQRIHRVSRGASLFWGSLVLSMARVLLTVLAQTFLTV